MPVARILHCEMKLISLKYLQLNNVVKGSIRFRVLLMFLSCVICLQWSFASIERSN